MSFNITTNAGQLALTYEARADHYHRSVQLLGKEWAKEALECAIILSSGRYSSATLAFLDHPYARRHGPNGQGGPLPAYIINAQTGVFRDAWKSGVTEIGDAIICSLLNDSDVARWMAGTRFMIARPILGAVVWNMGSFMRAGAESALRTVDPNILPRTIPVTAAWAFGGTDSSIGFGNADAFASATILNSDHGVAKGIAAGRRAAFAAGGPVLSPSLSTSSSFESGNPLFAAITVGLASGGSAFLQGISAGL